MALPASLLQPIENHPCFPGVWNSDADILVCLDPAKPLQRTRVVSCTECYARFGVLETLLSAGMNSSTLASQLTQHVRSLRGYTLSSGGYHARGPGFWVSVVYFGTSGLFLVDGSRSRKMGADLDLLLLAFQHGILQPFDPRLLDPAHYRTQAVHVNFATPPGPVRCKQDLLSWPGCRAQAAPGFQAATLAEFIPVASQAAAAVVATGTTKGNGSAKPGGPTAAAPAKLKVGDICPVCKAEFRPRPLLRGTYVGCLC